ncbi:MAG TPA: LLM class flavin-dependent oxidoreductase [Candidatus Limnocylindria bacterium]|nr:LLM class flavin-dependent oxidoreductase [Candidatus Limnocylindria bacterium]
MDLGIQIEPQFGFAYDDIVAIGKAGERAGFTRLWLSDHLFLDPEAIRTDCLEAWTALAALARDLETIRIGAMVTCQSYRNPALLAKIAAGVDRLCGGRLEFGLGAGWKEVEYRAYGYEFPEARVRVDELVDTLEVCRRMWTDDKATYAGTRYSITDALCSPKPVQSPLPIWIGGSKPRIFRIAAKYAHWVNHTAGDMTPSGVRVRQEALDVACGDRKRDPRTLKRSAFLTLIVGATPRDVDALVADAAARAKVTPDRWRAARPSAIVGTPTDVIARLREYAAVGIDHVNALFPYTREREMTELLGREAVAALA